MKHPKELVLKVVNARAAEIPVRHIAWKFNISPTTVQKWAKKHAPLIKQAKKDNQADSTFWHNHIMQAEVEGLDDLRKMLLKRLNNDPIGFMDLKYKDAARLLIALGKYRTFMAHSPAPDHLRFPLLPPASERAKQPKPSQPSPSTMSTESTPSTMSTGPTGTSVPLPVPPHPPETPNNPTKTPESVPQEKVVPVPVAEPSRLQTGAPIPGIGAPDFIWPSREERYAILRSFEHHLEQWRNKHKLKTDDSRNQGFGT